MSFGANFGAFVHAVKSDLTGLWHLIEGSPVTQEIEKIAVKAVASELEALADKVLGAETPLDLELEKAINELAAMLVAKMPKDPPVPKPQPPSAG